MSYLVWDEESENEPLEVDAYGVESAIWEWFNHEDQAEVQDDLRANGFTVLVKDVDRGHTERCHVNVVETLEISKG